MTAKEKAELLKDTITQLYSKEGRSKSYISRLLQIDRHTITQKIREWNLPEPEPHHYMKPSNQKNLNRNRLKIKSMLDKNYSMLEIQTTCKISQSQLRLYRTVDPVLHQAWQEWHNRQHNAHLNTIQRNKDNSSYQYDIVDLPDEVWKPILGFDGYMVSTMGRVKHYSKRNEDYHLLTPCPNKNNGRMYIALVNNKGKMKNLMLARLVAQTFIPHVAEKNTVNHIDGDVHNNTAANLEWTTQSKNNTHAYRKLNRKVSNKKRYHFDTILYKGKYEFKTVAAFSRFIGKSETQTRRYMDEPSKHDIKLINHCID